jgi:hypothetical protein
MVFLSAYLKQSIKMNNRTYNWLAKTLSFCLLLAMLSGCKKFLSQAPENSLTREAFFKTEADANSAIIGVYDALQTANTQFFRWGELRGDLISNDLDNVYLQLLDNTNTISNWTDAYRLIGRANIVIEKVPGIPALDPRFTTEKSKAITGEALFLRALSYFYLVRSFKEVPLVLQAPSSDAVDFLIPKSTSDQIFDQIEQDLTTAEKDVPDEYGRTLDTKGRVTKAAVNSLLTDVYLWRKKYAEAAAVSKKVLDNTDYTLVPGDDWFTIFSQKNSSESIFEIQYDQQLSEVNSLRNLSNANLVNNVLYNYFKEENDLVRGLNNTYREAGSRQFWKYTGLTTNNVDRASDDPNFIVYRLPDVMLMRAEALTHLGAPQKDEAGILINSIRRRANIDTLDFLNASTPLDVFNQVLLKSRAMELAMEGKRWFDLVRIATNENDPDILISRVVASRLVANRAQVRSRIIDPRSWYLPILRDELAKNPNLVQNPYYQ